MEHLDLDETADWISWRQILTAFVVVFCMAGALSFLTMEARTGLSLEWVPIAIIVVGAALVTVFEKQAARFQQGWLMQRPALDHALQWAAIVLLCAFSAATIVLGLIVTPL